MKIEVLKIKKINSETKLRAFVDICFGDKVIVSGCQIFDGGKGMFVGLPSVKSAKDGKYYPLVKLKDESDKKALDSVVIDAYKKESVETVTSNQEVPF
jgi:stage V sporulation protein G